MSATMKADMRQANQPTDHADLLELTYWLEIDPELAHLLRRIIERLPPTGAEP